MNESTEIHLTVEQAHDIMYTFAVEEIHTSAVSARKPAAGPFGASRVYKAICDGLPLLVRDAEGHRAWMVIPERRVFSVSHILGS